VPGIKPHLKEGAIIYIMPGQGGPDYVAKDVLGDEISKGKVTMAGIVPMPLNCRITDWGKRVELAALVCHDSRHNPCRIAVRFIRVERCCNSQSTPQSCSEQCCHR